MRRRDFLAVLAAVPCVARAGAIDDGDAAWALGDNDLAARAWEKALAAERDDPARVVILLRLVAAYREAGRLGLATERLDAAERLEGPTPRVANERGLLWLAGGRAPEAAELLGAAFKEAQAADAVAVAASLANNLGLAHTALGRHERATRAFEAAGQLAGLLGDGRALGDAFTNQGLSERREGKLAEARATLLAAVGQFGAVGATAGEADARNNLALVLCDLGADDLADAELKRALELATAPARRGAILANLAVVDSRAGRAKEAVTRFREAEAELRRGGRDAEAAAVALQRALVESPDATTYREAYTRAASPRARAVAALNLGALVVSTDPAEALALARAARDLSPSRDVAWRADFLEGKVALGAGRRDEALLLLGRAAEALDRTRRALGEADQQGFRLRHAAVYELLLDAQLAAGDTRSAAAVAERLALADLGAAPVPEGEAASLRAAEDRLAWLDRELAGATDERAAALRLQVGRAEADFAARVDELRLSTPHFAELVRTDPEDLEATRRELPAGAVVVQPVVLPDRLVLLLYRRERLVVREVAVGANVLNAAVMRLSRSLRAADTWDPAWTQSRCAELGAWLWAPVADELATATTVVVSATGLLRYLPFALLRHGDRWLVEAAAVANVTHVGSLRQGQGKFGTQGPTTLLVGNPDGSLPGAEAEARAIAQLVPGAALLVRDQGTRGAVLGACEGKTLVHLATHGVLDPEVPDRSHIVLTGYPDLAGRLGYHEIPALGPFIDRTRLVVLSACESGLPVDRPGAEGAPRVGINGLAAQFRRAGVETLVASLWSVSDAGTMALMTAFYERLAKGDDIAQAMRAAQRQLIGRPGFDHPYIWAPFVVVGDWR